MKQSKPILSIFLTLALALGLLALMPITSSAADVTAPMLAGGQVGSLALKSDGTVWAWGNNYYGTLGNGESLPGTNSASPVQVMSTLSTPLTGVAAVASSLGGSFSYALKTDGTVWAWGRNLNGVLGDGTTVDSSLPLQVKGTGGAGVLSGVKALSAGNAFCLALKNDGTVWAWGNNGNGQLGDGSTTNRPYPVQVLGAGGAGTLGNVKSISAGGSYCLALLYDGTVWAWGSNTSGQLGDGSTTGSSTPVQVLGAGGAGVLSDVKGIAAGGCSLAVKNDGTVWAWGSNIYGQLGDGTTVDSSLLVQVKGVGGAGNLSGIAAVAAGNQGHSIALASSGAVYAWGYNNLGQLGDGTNGTGTDKSTPVQVTDSASAPLSGMIVIQACDLHSLALKNDGTVWGWGANNNRNLGDGTTTTRNRAVQVTGPGGTGWLNLGAVPTSVAVTLNANGGTGGTASVTAAYGAAMPVITAPTRSGHDFLGYYDISAAQGGKQYYNASGASAATWDMNAPATLWARWIPSGTPTYTVTVSSAGTGASGSGTYAAGTIVSINAGTPPAGQSFINWTASGVTLTSPTTASTSFTMPAGAVTLTANFAGGGSTTYTVALNANGGSVTPASITVTNGGTYSALPTPTRSGHKFNGWYTAANGGTRVNNTDTVNLTGNTTLYAQWTKTIFSTKYVSNFWNWVLFIVCFGWIWMWFVK